MLMKNIQIKLIWPPILIGCTRIIRRSRSMHYWTFALATHIFHFLARFSEAVFAYQFVVEHAAVN